MTREEILNDWTVIDIATPKRGQFFISTPNHNPNRDKYSVVKCSKPFKTVHCTIVEKKVK